MPSTFLPRLHLSGDLTKVQRDIKAALDGYQGVDILNGFLIADVELKTGKNNEIGHPLDRAVQGYFVVQKSANAVIFNGSAGIGTSKNSFTLQCSADVTVSLWVF